VMVQPGLSAICSRASSRSAFAIFLASGGS
jgi:hypothetical protein